MAFASINWNPESKLLRQFGGIFAFASPLIAWLVVGRPIVAGWTGWAAGWVIGAAVVGAAVGLIGLLRPGLIKPIFLGLSLLTWPIGVVIGELTLALIFFAVITPVALYFRLIGRDALNRSIEKNRSSYWEKKSQPTDPARYFRQF
jgi:hypothetical protein